MKKTTSVLLASLLAASALVACGKLSLIHI